MKVVIAGSRTIDDYGLLIKAIERSGFTITEVISGCATGVDRLGETWALANNIPIHKMPANWNLYKKAAGPIRNRAMAARTDAAIILWDGVSKGTKNMISEMTRLDKPYYLMLTTSTVEDFFNDNNP